MLESMADFQAQLNEIDPDDDHFSFKVDRLLADLRQDLTESIYPAAFAFFEAHPESYCGCPGSLVHLVEHYYPNYVPALKDSVARTPSRAGVIMINRILNSKLSDGERADYMSILRNVAKDEAIPWVEAEQAEHFLKRREEIDAGA